MPSLTDQLVREIKYEIAGQIAASAGNDKPVVDKDRVRRSILRWLMHAMKTDPRVAKEVGKRGVDAKTIDGLIEAVETMHLGKLQKSQAEWTAILEKAEQLGLFGARPPAGFTAIPNSKHGGYHKKTGTGYVYWYPDTGIVHAPKATEPSDVHARHETAKPTEETPKPKITIVRRDPATGKETPIVPGLVVTEPASTPRLTLKPETEVGKYETTGYVFGSRAELWQLRNAGELEKDPTLAHKLVTKEAVIGGEVKPESFAAEREAGTEPAAAYLKYRLLQAIQTRPDDSSDARERFCAAIATVQKDLAELRTVADVAEWMQTILDQLHGVAPKETLTSEQLWERGWSVLVEDPPEYQPLFSAADYRRVDRTQQNEMRAQDRAVDTARRAEWRERRQAARQKMETHYGAEISMSLRLRETSDGRYVVLSPVTDTITNEAITNLEVLGPRFLALFGVKVSYPYRRARGGGGTPTRAQIEGWYGAGYWDKRRVEAADSQLRRNAYGEVHRIQGLDPGAGELDEQAQRALNEAWGWTAKKAKTKATERKEEERGDQYHTILAQARLGEAERTGPPVAGNQGIGSKEMTADLGLNVVEYGHWVTGKGAESTEEGRERQWHTEAAHAALHDLAHVVGIPPSQIGQKSRLTIAFGSRGAGKARATYHPEVKTINITKFHGKGSLAHEWGHFLDHMLMHVSAPGAGKTISLADLVAVAKGGDIDLPVPPAIVAAMRNVMDAIMHEPLDRVTAHSRARDEIENKRRAYEAERDRQKKEELRKEVNAAINRFNKDRRSPQGIKVPTAFHRAAKGMGDYWCRPHEMFARCWEAWVGDQLEAGGRTNTYLVHGTKSPLLAQFPGYLELDNEIFGDRDSRESRGGQARGNPAG